MGQKNAGLSTRQQQKTWQNSPQGRGPEYRPQHPPAGFRQATRDARQQRRNTVFDTAQYRPERLVSEHQEEKPAPGRF
jgi:hypothetical protein